jgi:hypothetical protein
MSRHDELRATWAPGQIWETRLDECAQDPNAWVPVGNGGRAQPVWDEWQEYRQRPAVDIDPENQYIGDLMILQVLADSDSVNDQEREVLLRWIELSQPPGVPVVEAPSSAKLCTYCGVVVDSGMVCTTDGEFNHCPNKQIGEAIGGVVEVRHQTEAPADADDPGIGHE